MNSASAGRRTLRNGAYREAADREGRKETKTLVATSACMRAVLSTVDALARTDLPVIIQGETGCGKELIARRMHAGGLRSNHPFVCVNCAALPHALLESELFGHSAGAFTGAAHDRRGLFAAAHRGTLLLDEIDEMDMTLQPKLLRVLQSGEIRPVGSDTTRRVDVRILVTTKTGLAGATEGLRFRQDLYHRLNGATVVIPPLRDRREDIAPLARHFLDKFGRPDLDFSPEAVDALLRHEFPGNVRELEMAIRRSAALTEGEWVTERHLALPGDGNGAPPAVTGAVELPLPSTARALQQRKSAASRRAALQVERDFLRSVLAKARGNVSKAAALAGVNRTQFHRMLARNDVRAGDFREETACADCTKALALPRASRDVPFVACSEA